MDRLASRSISKSTENLKNFFSFFQGSENNNHDDMNIGLSPQQQQQQSRSVSNDSNHYRTENNILRSLISRVMSELNCEQKQKYSNILSNPDRVVTIDLMLDIQDQILTSIQLLKQKAFNTHNFTGEDDDLRTAPESAIPHNNEEELPPNYFLSFEWQNCLEVHPPPPFDLDSPVVMHIFQTWTNDETKVLFLTNWILNLSTTNYDNVPSGIQITSISKVLRDAFIMLIIPIMRRRSLDPLTVSIRERFLHTARLDTDTVKAVPTQPIDFTSSTNPQDPPPSSDPFVKPDNLVYDIRIKRIIPGASSSTNSNSSTQKHSSHANSRPSFSHFHEIGSIDLNSTNLEEINPYLPPSTPTNSSIQSGTYKEVSMSPLRPQKASSAPTYTIEDQSDEDEHEREEREKRKQKFKETNLPEEQPAVIEIYFKENSPSRRKKYGDEDDDSVHSKEEFPISGVFDELADVSSMTKNNSSPPPTEEYSSFPILSGGQGKSLEVSDSTTDSKKSSKKAKIASKLESMRKK